MRRSGWSSPRPGLVRFSNISAATNATTFPDEAPSIGAGNRAEQGAGSRGVVPGGGLVPTEEAGLDGIADDVGAGPQAELVGDPRAVGLDRLDAQQQSLPDRLVGMPLGQQLEDFALALAQGVRPPPRPRRALE